VAIRGIPARLYIFPMIPIAPLSDLQIICSRFGGGNNYSEGSSHSSSGSEHSSSSGSSSFATTSSGGGFSSSVPSSASSADIDFVFLFVVIFAFLIKSVLQNENALPSGSQKEKVLSSAFPIWYWMKEKSLSSGSRIWYWILIPVSGVAILCGVHFFVAVFAIVAAIITDKFGWKALSIALSRLGSRPESKGLDPESTQRAPIESGLERRVRLAWPKLQTAWERQDLDPVRCFLSDGMQTKTQVQLDCLGQRGIRNRLEYAKVLEVKEGESVAGTVFTSTTVMIRASGKDVEVDLATGRSRPSADSDEFCEYWTFVKRTGVNPPDRGLLEGICPNCGSTIAVSASVVCSSCKSSIKSGEFDWVLTEISQQGAWRTRSREIDDLERKAIATDPGFNVYAIEDHAGMLFWKLVQSISTDRILKPSLPFHPEVKNHLMGRWASARFGPGFHLEPVVASVETIHLHQDAGMDQILVRIGWELGPQTYFHIDQNVDALTRTFLAGIATITKRRDLRGFGEEYLASDRENLLKFRESEYLFERSIGAKTSIHQNLTSGHCQSCGGPESADPVESCPWCGSTKPHGEGSWTLRSITSGCNQLGI